MSAVIAIVGRPNVGKSTIFNRLIGKRQAIESGVPGTTRDRLYHMMEIDGYDCILVDTGGLEFSNTGDDIEDNVQEQSKIAIEGADVILFVIDIKSDLTSADFHAADILRKSKKTVILIANKCDNPTLTEQKYNLYELGFGEPVAVTAVHAAGFSELTGKIGDDLKKQGFKRTKRKEENENIIKIAFLGRPNVGKSTMINGLLGEERVVTSKTPGTTRDSTEIPFEYNDNKFLLIDTAGLRRRGKIEKGIEKFSMLRTLQSVELADICILLLDIEEGITNQDCHVSNYVLEQNKGLIIVVNKIDLFSGDEREEKENWMIAALRKKMAYIPWAPIVFTSAKKHKNIFKILELSEEIEKERKKVLKHEDLKIWLEDALTKHPPRGERGKRRFNVLDLKQTGENPPEITFYCNWPDIMHFSYGRYLENGLREKFGFNGTSLSLRFKKTR